MANLLTLLKASEKQVRKIATKELCANGYKPIVHEQYIYAEGSVPVLLVAHYDTVLAKPPTSIRISNGWLSAKKGLGADDRAGVYAILEIIRKHHCYVLFTGGEEKGCIGAEAFTKSGIKPDVNYIIELDRKGDNDAVYYDGANDKFEDFITSHGWKTAYGSFTDICTLAPYIGVAAVNLSIGYYDQHTPNETLDTNAMNKIIGRVPALFEGERYEWGEDKFSRYYGGYYGGKYDDYYDYALYGSKAERKASFDEAYDMGFTDGYDAAVEDMLNEPAHFQVTWHTKGGTKVTTVLQPTTSKAAALYEFMRSHANLCWNDIDSIEVCPDTKAKKLA